MLSSGIRTVSRYGTRSIASLSTLENVKVVDLGDGVTHVQLNRPKRMNAMTFGLWDDLKTSFDHLNTCSSTRAVVLSGNGPAFGVGLDLKEAFGQLVEIGANKDKDVSRKAFDLLKAIRKAQDSFIAVTVCRKPVIAAIHGFCIGGTISLAGMADIRYAEKSTVFNIKEVDVGLAADVGILNVISKATGNDSWCRELAFTARDFNGVEGLERGFVSRVFDSKQDCLNGAIDLARFIASKSPVAVQGSKIAMNYARDHGVHETFDFLQIWNSVHLQSDDMPKIAEAMMKKQKPKFSDL
ncbi:unnamed protein product [Bursaphelenchus okinawaensis]|uniref:Uncharacterized protein n=1 Tax=Bursaphelenchus okinawaensis TaxID=465554 RepID=A0A811K2Q2_9BILA|nr:unnamed protein product [Bursaphelenchus okinawaensis]CAG9090671.1 unnamed protein product [Bursaphelenchus okinawaensis]